MPCWLLVEVKIEKERLGAFEKACQSNGYILDGLTVRNAQGQAIGQLKDFGGYYQMQLLQGRMNTDPLFRAYAENVAMSAVEDLAGELLDRVENPDGSLLLRVRVTEYA
jgi:hypothetical protein